MSLPRILDDPAIAAAIEHNLKCGACGAPATHEQCGGALVCDAHIMPGRAWTIDAKTIELHGRVTRHATNEHGDCATWCRTCERNVLAGLNPDGTEPQP